MSPWRKATAWVVCLTFFGVVFYDLAAAVLGGYEATISKWTLDGATVRPVIALALGVLVGHLIWPRTGSVTWRIAAGVALVWGAAAGLWLLDAPATILAGLTGIALGHLTWPQPVPVDVPTR